MRPALLLFVATVACGTTRAPRGQLVLHFDTDAPLSSREPRAFDLLAPLPLFDRLRVGVYPPSSSAPCGGCENEFQVDAELFSSRAASLGIPLPPGAEGWRVRARLFPGALVDELGEPTASTTIDVWTSLPPNAREGVVHITAFLAMDDVGRTNPLAPVPPALGEPDSSKVGTWPGATRLACRSQSPGRVCVPGGAFWMGRKGTSGVQGHSPGWHRLVILRSFLMDAQEITVAHFRERGGVTLPWSGSTTGKDSLDWCTFTPIPGPRDDLPVSCVSWTEARTWCRYRGGDLPTEAQFELVATGYGRSMFSWGNDLPGCFDAIWGRAGTKGAYADVAAKTCAKFSKALGDLGGPEVAGSGALDVLAGLDGEIVDINGNLNEWMRDRFADENEPCWEGTILRDPHCDVTSLSDRIVMRGGAWDQDITSMRGDIRFDESANVVDASVGFRCVFADP